MLETPQKFSETSSSAISYALLPEWDEPRKWTPQSAVPHFPSDLSTFCATTLHPMPPTAPGESVAIFDSDGNILDEKRIVAICFEYDSFYYFATQTHHISDLNMLEKIYYDEKM